MNNRMAKKSAKKTAPPKNAPKKAAKKAAFKEDINLFWSVFENFWKKLNKLTITKRADTRVPVLFYFLKQLLF